MSSITSGLSITEGITITESIQYTRLSVEILKAEVDALIGQLELVHEGEHLWSNYEIAVGIILRLGAMHNDLAYLEMIGDATAEQKKFRTMIIDPTIERVEKVAAFESRKITARQIEAQLDK